MTLGQVRTLCAGLQALERADVARRIHEARLAFHGDEKDVNNYLNTLEPARDGPDATDMFLAKYQGRPDGTEPVA